jgi:hypothetical protein
VREPGRAAEVRSGLNAARLIEFNWCVSFDKTDMNKRFCCTASGRCALAAGPGPHQRHGGDMVFELGEGRLQEEVAQRTSDAQRLLRRAAPVDDPSFEEWK